MHGLLRFLPLHPPSCGRILSRHRCLSIFRSTSLRLSKSQQSSHLACAKHRSSIVVDKPSSDQGDSFDRIDASEIHPFRCKSPPRLSRSRSEISQRSRRSASQIRLLFGEPSCRGPDKGTQPETRRIPSTDEESLFELIADPLREGKILLDR